MKRKLCQFLRFWELQSFFEFLYQQSSEISSMVLPEMG